jgi:AcrR family transcriptional regulator
MSSLKKPALTFEKPPVSSRPNGGRPPEDRFARRMEIFAAVAPHVLSRGARNLSMRQAASAAHVSVGTLYHYFSSKQELLLFPLLPTSCAEAMRRFEEAHADVRARDPQRYLKLFVEHHVQGVVPLRAALQAALEFGAEDFWDAVDKREMDAQIERLVDAVEAVRGPVGDRTGLARAIRRVMVSGLVDRHVTPIELGQELRALIHGWQAAVPTT